MFDNTLHFYSRICELFNDPLPAVIGKFLHFLTSLLSHTELACCTSSALLSMPEDELREQAALLKAERETDDAEVDSDTEEKVEI